MTTTTRNEAAERLRAIHKEMREDGYLEPLRRPDALLDEALAAAKAEGAREAVERIRVNFADRVHNAWGGEKAEQAIDLLRWAVDEEAAR